MSHNLKNTPDIRLGFTGLSALVFSMMVGAGIFNIPQNMAIAAGPGAVIVSWLITAAGMLLLVGTFKILSDRRPELNAGMYLYARRGFGMFAGFMTAWGYWLCTAFANVAYVVMLNDTFGAIFPPLLGHGWPTLIFGSALIWLIYFIVISGMRTAKIINTLMSAIKIGCILLIIVLLFIHLRLDAFIDSFSAQNSAGLPDMATQIKDSMLVTLWCFIGIEGAVMMSGRARRSKDVGRAGVTGFFTAWILYVLVSLLCFGVMTRARLAGLDDPSVAYLLKECCGSWAYWLVIASVALSLGGGWIAWSLVCAEVPYMAAETGLFPRRFLSLNRHRIPAFGLFVSSIIMDFFLVIVMFSEHVYLTALSVTGMMILPAYLLTGMFLWKISRGKHPTGEIIGAGCTLFCIWLIYAGGLELFLETSIFYLFGLGFYFKVLRERDKRLKSDPAPSSCAIGHTRLSVADKAGILILVLASAVSVFLLIH